MDSALIISCLITVRRRQTLCIKQDCQVIIGQLSKAFLSQRGLMLDSLRYLSLINFIYSSFNPFCCVSICENAHFILLRPDGRQFVVFISTNFIYSSFHPFFCISICENAHFILLRPDARQFVVFISTILYIAHFILLLHLYM